MEQEVVEPALEITPQPTIDGTQEAIANGDHVKAEVAENNTIEEVAVADVVVQSVEVRIPLMPNTSSRLRPS